MENNENHNQAASVPNSAREKRVLREVRRLSEELRAIEEMAVAVRVDLAALESQLSDTFGAGAPVPLLAYTVQQAGEALGLSRTTMAAMISRGEVRSVKTNGSRRVLIADLIAYVEQLDGA